MSTPNISLAEIKQNARIAQNIYGLELHAQKIVQKANPGQFLYIRCSDTADPLLRRPMSIADVDENTGNLTVIYQIVGKGTRLLSQKPKGEKLDIMGPLGKGFPLPKKDKSPIIIGGGMGIAPLLYLAKKIGKTRKSDNPVIAFLGFASEHMTFGIDYLHSLGIKTAVATDDGSLGYKGFPTQLLENYLKRIKNKSSRIFYACGPKPMLGKIKAIAVRESIPTYLSLEEHMACGIGACLGCSVRTPQGDYKRVCKDGPVFKADEILLDK